MKVIIKGDLISMDRNLLGVVVFGLINIFLIGLILLKLFLFLTANSISEAELIENYKTSIERTAISELIFLSLFLFTYYLTTSNNYYYEFGDKSLVVKNLLKSYNYEIEFKKINKVFLYGRLDMPKVVGNSMKIQFEENGQICTKKFISYNLYEEDWIQLLKKLEELKIQYTAPYDEFFKYSNYKSSK
jgi:hypothetical protein